MKFSVGDKIKLRKTNEEGVVVDIVQEQYLRVRIDGNVIPVEEADIDFPYLDWFLKRNEESKKKKVFIDNIKVDSSIQSAESMFPEGLYLLFQPVYREHQGEDIINRIAIYLFSEWATPLDYLVDISIKGKKAFSYEGIAAFQQRQLLYSFSFDEAGDNPVFDFEVMEQNKKMAPKHFFSIKLTRKKLIEHVRRLERENLAIFEIPVFNKLKPASKLVMPEMGQKISAMSILGTAKTQRKAKVEIDLHIEKIYHQSQRLENDEKLHIQIEYFQTYLDLAIADERVNPFRVIHGIGEGILKKEINSVCLQTFEVQDYVYDKCNPGVTLIYFKN